LTPSGRVRYRRPTVKEMRARQEEMNEYCICCCCSRPEAEIPGGVRCVRLTKHRARVEKAWAELEEAAVDLHEHPFIDFWDPGLRQRWVTLLAAIKGDEDPAGFSAESHRGGQDSWLSRACTV
jgi:hypothetical protein